MGRRLGGRKWLAGGVAQRQGMAGGWTEQSQGEKSSRPCLKARRASGLSPARPLAGRGLWESTVLLWPGVRVL